MGDSASKTWDVGRIVSLVCNFCNLDSEHFLMYSHMERPIKGPESCVGDLNKESGSNAESL